MLMSNRQILACSVLAMAILALTPFRVAAKDSPKNERLSAAVEPFEGLTETALTGDTNKIDGAFKTAQRERAATRALLPVARIATYDKLFATLEAAQAQHDSIAVSLHAAELYKLIVSTLDASTLTVPMEVNLLDYSGFRINALLKATPPDWTAIAGTVQDANAWWAKISSRVTDKKLQARMAKSQTDLAAAAKTRDAGLSRSSAKSDLDLVDELESYFTKANNK